MGPDQELIDEVIATFPKTFGLQAHDGVFRISARDSYFTGPKSGEGRLMLYTERLRENGEWVSFAKGTESELRNNIVEIPQRSLNQLEVVVGNIGSVYKGTDPVEAADVFEEYMEQSKSGRGRAAGEDVVLFEDGEITVEHTGGSDSE